MQARITDQLHHVSNKKRARQRQTERWEPGVHKMAIQEQDDRGREQATDHRQTRQKDSARGIICLDLGETCAGGEKKAYATGEAEHGGNHGLR